MKLKYYLRGIGIGMIVTALLFIIGASRSNQMSDTEIIARAKELGLVEKTVLREPSSTEEASKEEVDSDEEISENMSQESEPESVEEEAESSLEETSEDVSEPASEIISETEESEEVIEEYVVIAIVSGDSSVSVSQKVFEAGLVESALEFDRFLCANGYDRRLSVGQHEIKAGASMKEIAEELTNG